MGVMRQILTAFALLAGLGIQQASAARFLASHRAVYDLSLDKASDKSGITALTGRMVYEFSGSACEGYTTNFRYVTRIDTDDVSRLTDQQTTTFEDGAGKNFSFVTKSFVDQDLDTEVKGTATRGPEGTKVKLVKPKVADLSLRESWFPTEHLVDLLGKAERGEHFYETNLFDGSDSADRVMNTSVVIGKRKQSTPDDPEYSALASLKHDSYWPVTIAYFDTKGDKARDMLPTYSISLRLHGNGVTRDLLMDYGDFSIKGTLVDLDVFKPNKEKCNQ